MVNQGFEGFDRITLTGVDALGYHGVLPSERENGQPFIVDVVLHAEIRQAGRTDDLDHTVDYSEVADTIVAAITGQPLNLIEALAQRIAESIFALESATRTNVSVVEVTVHKPQAPINVPFSDVSVTIVRVR